jgi:hypothetical protein
MKQSRRRTEVEELRNAERGLRNIESGAGRLPVLARKEQGQHRCRLSINLQLSDTARGSHIPQPAFRIPQLNLCPQKHSSQLSTF